MQRSLPNVYEVKKLSGTNNAFMLTLSTEYAPDYVHFGNHIRMNVTRFRSNPKQCRSCFEYGNISDGCKNEKRGYRCSETHEENIPCHAKLFCFLCDGNHSPSSSECPRKKMERASQAISPPEPGGFSSKGLQSVLPVAVEVHRSEDLGSKAVHSKRLRTPCSLLFPTHSKHFLKRVGKSLEDLSASRVSESPSSYGKTKRTVSET